MHVGEQAHEHCWRGDSATADRRAKAACAGHCLPHHTWTEASGPTCQPLHCQPWSPCAGPRSSGSYSCLQPSCWPSEVVTHGQRTQLKNCRWETQNLEAVWCQPKWSTYTPEKPNPDIPTESNSSQLQAEVKHQQLWKSLTTAGPEQPQVKREEMERGLCHRGGQGDHLPLKVNVSSALLHRGEVQWLQAPMP